MEALLQLPLANEVTPIFFSNEVAVSSELAVNLDVSLQLCSFLEKSLVSTIIAE